MLPCDSCAKIIAEFTRKFNSSFFVFGLRSDRLKTNLSIDEWDYEFKKYGIYFFVNNIFDEGYYPTAFRESSPLVFYGDRRTFGFQVKASF